MKKVLIGVSSAVALFGFASSALALNSVDLNTVGSGLNGLQGLMVTLTGVLNTAVPFLLAVAVVIFIYGVIKYAIAAGPEEKSAARGYIIWGIVGIAVIVSIFGLVSLLQSTFGLNNGSTSLSSSDLPQINS